MSCPHNFLGQPACNIVKHPDRPEEESFCATCEKRFQNNNSYGATSDVGVLSVFAIVGLVLIFALL